MTSRLQRQPALRRWVYAAAYIFMLLYWLQYSFWMTAPFDAGVYYLLIYYLVVGVVALLSRLFSIRKELVTPVLVMILAVVLPVVVLGTPTIRLGRLLPIGLPESVEVLDHHYNKMSPFGDSYEHWLISGAPQDIQKVLKRTVVRLDQHNLDRELPVPSDLEHWFSGQQYRLYQVTWDFLLYEVVVREDMVLMFISVTAL